MFPSRCDYHRAESLDEALALLGRHQDATLLAGGHSLIPLMKLRLAQPTTLVDIGRVPELRGIASESGVLRLGALTTHAELATSPEVVAASPILAEAAAQIADPQVRHRGTLAGNIAHADPGSDLPAVLLAVGAVVHVIGAEGRRRIPAEEFFVGLLTSALASGEIITHVEIGALAPGTGSCYLKFEHPASGYAVCGAAAIVERSADGSCTDARLAFNGVTAKPFRADAVEEAVRGGALTDEALEAALTGHLELADPLSDLFASAEYRTRLARVYGRRALAAARDRAG